MHPNDCNSHFQNPDYKIPSASSIREWDSERKKWIENTIVNYECMECLAFSRDLYTFKHFYAQTQTHTQNRARSKGSQILNRKKEEKKAYTLIHEHFAQCRQWKSEIYRQFASYIGTLCRIRQWDEQVIQRNAPQYIQNKSGADFHAQFRFCLHLSAVNIVGWCWVWYNLKFTCLPFLTRNAVLCIQFSYSWNCLYMTESIRQRRQQQSRQ